MMQQVPTNYILPEQSLRAIAEYLSVQSYREVVHLMAALGALERLHLPQPSFLGGLDEGQGTT